jgi:archaellum biogenesis ATPase FlaH
MLNKTLQQCPKCASSRKKKHLATCSVIEFESGYSYKCFHCGYKEFIQTKERIVMDKDEIEKVQITDAIEIPDGEVPFESEDTIFHKYYKDNKCVMLIARRGSGDDKWIRPFILTDEGWVTSDTKGPFLYRSEFLHDDGRPVLVVEGEKAADAAAKIFTKADVVSWKGGATAVLLADWAKIDNRDIVLWPDNDPAGKDAMNKLAGVLKSKSIYLVDVSSLPPKTDLADNLSLDTIAEIYKTRKNVAKPMLRGIIDTDNVQSMFENIEEGLSLGWPGMDKYIKLPTHGLVVIPGRTNHGKSLFQINMMANLLRQTNTACIYLSYEMPNDEIILRLIKTLNGTAFDPVGYKDDLVYKQKIQNNELPEVDEVNKYIQQDRLFITDADVGVEEVEETIRYLAALKRKVVIFIDYLQLVPANRGRQERYLEVKNIVEKFRQLANEFKYIIVGGSQLTSGDTPFQDQARESKDISFTAALILKVWNKESARVTGTVKQVKDPDNPREKIEADYYDDVPGTFVVEVIKSRQGSLGRTIGFKTTNGCKLVEAAVESKGGF